MGKTTLLNRLTNQALETENILFHTLNTTIRKANLRGSSKASIVDTVGFITDLPHTLIDPFKSTLEETLHADILVHV